MRIRTARPDDLDEIERIEKLCFPSGPWSRNSLEAEIDNENARFWVADDESGVLGYIHALVAPPFEAQICNLAVDVSARRKGYARALMVNMIQYCVMNGIRGLSLEVRVSNEAAKALYESLGFAAVGIRKKYYEGKEDAIVMWLDA